MKNWFDRFKMSLDDAMDMFKSFHSQHHNKRRVKIQLAPANLHWCSDKALGYLSDASAKYDAPMHMHLVETAYQKGICQAPRRLHGAGIYRPLRPGDATPDARPRRVAEREGYRPAGGRQGLRPATIARPTSACARGVAALNFFEKKGINTAIGLDEAGINDDRDMLQEMKLVLRAHRVPGMVDEDVPTMAQVLRMATVGGARTTPYGEHLGALEVGKGADMVLIDWDKVAYPYLDELTPTLDAVVQRAKNDAVTMTMCDGEVIYKDGLFTKVDKTEALKKLHDDLSKALSDDEVERRNLSKALLPHVRKFYANYIDPSKHEPFYRPSSMV